MAAVRSLQVKSDSGSDRSEPNSDSESDRDAREAEPMEVEEGELEAEDISVNRSLKELLPDTSRRYENKAGAFITGIDEGLFNPEDDELEHQLDLRMACVDPSTKDELHTVEVEGRDSEGQVVKATLVTLKPSTLPSVCLGGFTITPPAVFRLKAGSGPVHLSGQHLIMMETGQSFDESEEEEEEEEEQEDQDEDMDSDDRVVEYKERGGDSRTVGAGLCSRAERSPSPWSESDEMDYDLELKMISTPSPKKTKKMTMYADELETQLKTIRNRIGASGSQSRTKSSSPAKVTDVRQLLEEKRQGASQHRERPPVASSGKTDVRQRLGKRRYSPDERSSPSPLSPKDTPPVREPVSDVHRRLGVANQDSRSVYSKPVRDRKTSSLWSRLGSSNGDDAPSKRREQGRSEGLFSSASGRQDGSRRRRGEGEREVEEEDDSKLQRMWGAMIKQKQDRLTHKMKKSRLDHLPSLQIEISRDSTDDSDV
uniref:Nuclear cap-binding protein subunit 3 n=1 Tax=Nothobranchius pienaari TaxID=704102 RepID=A0A1A8QTK9_9TELE